MPEIKGSVGKGGVNRLSDAKIVQSLLNNHVTALGLKALVIDGDAAANTIKAIRAFQKQVVGLANPDGCIDPDGRTWKALNATASAPPPEAMPVLAGDKASRMSGKAWWHANQAQYSNSNSVQDIAPPFRECVASFIAAMREGGARVGVTSTRRNKIRAYLMHFSWRLSKGQVRARDIPDEPGCTILWDHGDEAKSRRAAGEMAGLFGIAFKPSLTSRHIRGLAIDMTISWNGTIQIKDKAGRSRPVSTPRSGNTNPALHAIGKTYGVIKLASDPPHWSDNGH